MTSQNSSRSGCHKLNVVCRYHLCVNGYIYIFSSTTSIGDSTPNRRCLSHLLFANKGNCLVVMVSLGWSRKVLLNHCPVELYSKLNDVVRLYTLTRLKLRVALH
jgi:hypothetical protein